MKVLFIRLQTEKQRRKTKTDKYERVPIAVGPLQNKTPVK